MNMSRKVSIALAVVLAVLLVGGGVWFWSIGSVAAEKLPSIRVQVTSGTVSYKASGASDFQTVADVQEIHAGDTVKTGASSEAEILWGDLGVTRLDENAEVVINDAPADSSGENAVINLKVNAGRVWSRMLKLLDVGSSMEVQTSDVVATVRGTSFGIVKNASSTDAAVSESVVAMTPANGGDETLVADNEWGTFGNDGKPRLVRKLTDADAWPALQKEKDGRFDRDYLAVMRVRFQKRVDALKKAPDWIRNASESLHLAVLGGDAKKKLAIQYARQHLAAGDVSGVRARLAAAGDKAGVLRSEVHAMATLLSRTRTTPDRIESLRGLRDALGKLDTPNQQYRGLVRIDEGIDDYLDGNFETGKKTEAASALINRIDQAEQEIKDKNLGDNRLTEKTKALRKRLADALGIAPQDLPASEPPVVLPDNGKAPVRSIKNDPSLNPPVLKQAPTSRLYQRLQLLPSPSTVAVGAPVKLKLFGVKADGQADDISSQATFTSSAGALSGSVLTPSAVGIITVSGSFTDAQGSRTATSIVTVTKVAATTGTGLQSIAVTLVGTNTVACGSSFPFKVMGTYADGSVKDVTVMSTDSSSDNKMLYVGQGTATASCPSDQQITVTINASVNDKGTVKTGSTNVIIMRDPNGAKTCPAYLARYGGC